LLVLSVSIRRIGFACHSADGSIQQEVQLLRSTQANQLTDSIDLIRWMQVNQLTDHTHTRLTALLSGTTQVSRYQKGKTNLDFTEASDSEWQWHQLGCMQVCTSLQTDNHTSTPPLSFSQTGCPSCCRTNSVIALNAKKAS